MRRLKSEVMMMVKVGMMMMQMLWFLLFILFDVSWAGFVCDKCASSESFDYQSADRLSHVAIFDWDPCFGNCSKNAAVGVDSTGVYQDSQECCQDVDSGDNEDVEELVGLVCLVDGIARREDDEREEEDEEGGEGGRVEYAE